MSIVTKYTDSVKYAIREKNCRKFSRRMKYAIRNLKKKIRASDKYAIRKKNCRKYAHSMKYATWKKKFRNPQRINTYQIYHNCLPHQMLPLILNRQMYIDHLDKSQFNVRRMSNDFLSYSQKRPFWAPFWPLFAPYLENHDFAGHAVFAKRSTLLTSIKV